MAGALAVPLPSGDRERDWLSDGEKEGDAVAHNEGAGERLSMERDAQGVPVGEALARPDAEGDCETEVHGELVGVALALRVTLRDVQGEAEAEAEPAPPRPFVTVRVPVAAPDEVTERQPDTDADRVVTTEAETTSVKVRVSVPWGEALREGETEAQPEEESGAEGDTPDAERAPLRLSLFTAEGVMPEGEGCAEPVAQDGVGALLALSRSDQLPLKLSLVVAVVEAERDTWEPVGAGLSEPSASKSALGVAAPVGVPPRRHAVGKGGTVSNAPAVRDAASEREIEDDAEELGLPLGDPLPTAERVADRPGVTVREPVKAPEVLGDALGEPLGAGEPPPLTETVREAEVTSVMV